MLNIIAIGRIGIFGAGLGIGATLALGPGIAAADPAADPNIYGAIDPSLLQDALPAADPNIAISVDGFTLLQDGTASATSGSGDFAIAVGDGANATATGGFGDYASAHGADASAFAGEGNFDVATANSVFSTTGGSATAGDGNFDVAHEGGLNGVALAGNGSFDSAYDLTGASGHAIADLGNGDSAINIGDGSAIAGGTSESFQHSRQLRHRRELRQSHDSDGRLQGYRRREFSTWPPSWLEVPPMRPRPEPISWSISCQACSDQRARL